MVQEIDGKPCFKTAEEHDVYVLGLMCGAMSAVKDLCDDANLIGIEAVEDTLGSLGAYLESALEFGEKSFEGRIKENLSGTRISAQTLIEAWELGCQNGRRSSVGPFPEILKHHKKI